MKITKQDQEVVYSGEMKNDFTDRDDHRSLVRIEQDWDPIRSRVLCYVDMRGIRIGEGELINQRSQMKMWDYSKDVIITISGNVADAVSQQLRVER